MQRCKIFYAILCVGLCAPVAFAAQEPLTPEVSRDNMLVTPDKGEASTAQKDAEPAVKKTEVPAPNASYKPTLPTDTAQKVEAVPPAPLASAASPAKPAALPKEEEKGVIVPVPPLTPSLGRLTVLRGQLEEKKMLVAIAEQDARLRQVTMPSPPPASVVQAVPQIPLDMLLDSQKVKLGKSPTPSPVPVKSTKGVVSIQGVNGVLSATIATGRGTVTVKQGDAFGGGRVESITYNQVMVRSGKKTAPIPFVE